MSDHFVGYLKRKVESGEFGSASEVARDALRRAEERDRRLAWLQSAVKEGIDSGLAHDFDFDGWLDAEFPEDECRDAAE